VIGETPLGRVRAWIASPVSTVGFALAFAAVAVVVAWGISSVAAGVSARHTDNRLKGAAANARTLLAQRIDAAAGRAADVAGSPAVVRAILRRDVATLSSVARRRGVVFALGGGIIGTKPPPGSLSREVVIYSGSKPLGRIEAPVVLDTAFVDQVAAESHLGRRDVLYIQHGGNITSRTGVTAKISSGSRTVRRTLLASKPPTDVIGAAKAWRGLSWLPLLAIALIAFMVGLVVAQRRPVRSAAPGRAVRDAVSLVGETLAATHNPGALLAVMLESAIEATHAAGGVLLRGGKKIDSRGGALTGEQMRIGFRDAFDGSTLTMVLAAGDGSFTKDAREAAEWITAQAAIALENAHLHQLVQEQAVTDELTGLANRRQFLDALEHELARSSRTGETTSLVLCDLDDFKLVNDRFGHPAGDEALRVVGRVLRETVRELDVPARLGGEEFAVVLPNTTLDGAVRLAERIRVAIEHAAIVVGGHRIVVTVSLGVAAHAEGETLDELMQQADRCLYAAKEAGKNVVVSGPEGPRGNVGRRPESLRRSPT
jgi:diguanylate cyclase (GGDEF)-like protein